VPRQVKEKGEQFEKKWSWHGSQTRASARRRIRNILMVGSVLKNKNNIL